MALASLVPFKGPGVSRGGMDYKGEWGGPPLTLVIHSPL
jgi:hypothetical protein